MMQVQNHMFLRIKGCMSSEFRLFCISSCIPLKEILCAINELKSVEKEEKDQNH